MSTVKGTVRLHHLQLKAIMKKTMSTRLVFDQTILQIYSLLFHFLWNHSIFRSHGIADILHQLQDRNTSSDSDANSSRSFDLNMAKISNDNIDTAIETGKTYLHHQKLEAQ